MTYKPFPNSEFRGLVLAWFLNFILIFLVISAICQCYSWIFYRRSIFYRRPIYYRPVSPILHPETVYHQHPPHSIPCGRAVYQVRECSPKIDSVSPTTVSTKPVTMNDMDDF